MKRNLTWYILGLAIMFTLCMWLGGCAETAPTKSVGLRFVPPSHGISDLYAPLGWLVIIGVIGVAAGVGIYAFVSKSLGLAIGGSAAALEGSALILRVALPIIPYIASGLGILAVLVLAWEVYTNRTTLATDLSLNTKGTVK